MTELLLIAALFVSLPIVLAIVVRVLVVKRILGARFLTGAEALLCISAVLCLLYGLIFAGGVLKDRLGGMFVAGYAGGNIEFSREFEAELVYYLSSAVISILALPYLIIAGIRRYARKNKVSPINHTLFTIIAGCCVIMVYAHIDKTWNRYQTKQLYANTMVALDDYNSKYGQLPKKLEELVPEFMDKVPIPLVRNSGFTYIYDDKHHSYTYFPDAKLFSMIIYPETTKFCFSVDDGSGSCEKLPISKEHSNFFRCNFDWECARNKR